MVPSKQDIVKASPQTGKIKDNLYTNVSSSLRKVRKVKEEPIDQNGAEETFSVQEFTICKEESILFEPEKEPHCEDGLDCKSFNKKMEQEINYKIKDTTLTDLNKGNIEQKDRSRCGSHNESIKVEKQERLNDDINNENYGEKYGNYTDDEKINPEMEYIEELYERRNIGGGDITTDDSCSENEINKDEYMIESNTNDKIENNVMGDLTSSEDSENDDKQLDTNRTLEDEPYSLLPSKPSLNSTIKASSKTNRKRRTIMKTTSMFLNKDLIEDLQLQKKIRLEGRNKFICNTCEFTAIHASLIIRHINTHMDERKYHCDICNYKALSKDNLKQHMKIHSGRKNFHCKLCDYKTAENYILNEHMKIHTIHSVQGRNYPCNICEYRAIDYIELINHMKIHKEKMLSCNICDYKTSKDGNLTAHMIMHPGEKRFHCKLCEFKTTQNANLKNHMVTHAGNYFVCKICDFKATHNKGLMLHMKTHSEEKTIKCEICNYKTFCKSRLNVHMKIHIGEKKYVCHICDRKYISNSNLKKHLKVHISTKLHPNATM